MSSPRDRDGADDGSDWQEPSHLSGNEPADDDDDRSPTSPTGGARRGTATTPPKERPGSRRAGTCRPRRRTATCRPPRRTATCRPSDAGPQPDADPTWDRQPDVDPTWGPPPGPPLPAPGAHPPRPVRPAGPRRGREGVRLRGRRRRRPGLGAAAGLDDLRRQRPRGRRPAGPGRLRAGAADEGPPPGQRAAGPLRTARPRRVRHRLRLRALRRAGVRGHGGPAAGRRPRAAALPRPVLEAPHRRARPDPQRRRGVRHPLDAARRRGQPAGAPAGAGPGGARPAPGHRRRRRVLDGGRPPRRRPARTGTAPSCSSTTPACSAPSSARCPPATEPAR